jgi:hypothetical protein
LLPAGPPASAGGIAHIRVLDAYVADLLQTGIERSPTIRRLVEAVNASDLVVYIECHNRFRRSEGGEFHLAGAARGYRYVRIGLSSALNDRELTVMLAHELQHAAELAAATDVASQRGMEDLYCRIGDRARFGFDTAAARAVTERVGEELAQSADR